jgi:hypothetical protein
MCQQMKFSTAVLVAVRDVAAAQPKFSVHDITKALRESVNQGDVAFSDRTTEDVNGVDTFRVAHDEVKEYFNDLVGSGVLNLNKRHNGNYFEYSDNGAVSSTSAASAPISSTPKNASVPTNGKTDLSAKIKAYLDGRGSGSVVSMKQVQSRFDDEKFTCADYGAKVQALGYMLDNSSPHPSKWTVTVP